MTTPARTCDATQRDEPCLRAPVLIRPVRLCQAHLASVIHQAASLIADNPGFEVDEATDETIIRSAVPVHPMDPDVDGLPVVYFIANGARMKIGYTARIRNRVSSLSLRYGDIQLLLTGGPTLERALHRHFSAARVGNTEWFNLDDGLTEFIARKASNPAAKSPRHSASVRYPDGVAVGQDQWPDLYRVFADMKDGATKEELTEVGPFASRDTVRRALDAWTQHGVQSRKDGRSTRYYLPTT